MEVFSTLNIAGSGLSAHRQWMDIIAGNIANAQTTRTPEGKPFRELLPVFQEISAKGSLPRGVKITEIKESDAELKRVYQPEHPDADEEGYVSYPNVDVVRSMVDLISASRAYEANASVAESAKSNFMRMLQLLQA
jgi:flagellar basal-body rod protein FlgC